METRTTHAPAGPETPQAAQPVQPPPPPPPAGWHGYAPVAPPQPKVPEKAWISIAIGILGLLLLPLGFILSMVAMAFGGMAWDDARVARYDKGKVAAAIGIALGVAGFVISRIAF